MAISKVVANIALVCLLPVLLPLSAIGVCIGILFTTVAEGFRFGCTGVWDIAMKR